MKAAKFGKTCLALVITAAPILGCGEPPPLPKKTEGAPAAKPVKPPGAGERDR